MKVLVDMNLSPRWIDLLNRFDIQATHWSSVGNPQAFDQEIMSHASEHGYIVLTNDLDFGAILAVTHGQKPSVVQIRSEDLNPDVIGERTSTRCINSSINTAMEHLSRLTRCARVCACFHSSNCQERITSGRIGRSFESCHPERSVMSQDFGNTLAEVFLSKSRS